MYVLDQRLDLHKMLHDIRVIVYLAVDQQVDIADAPGTVNICTVSDSSHAPIYKYHPISLTG